MDQNHVDGILTKYLDYITCICPGWIKIRKEVIELLQTLHNEIVFERMHDQVRLETRAEMFYSSIVTDRNILLIDCIDNARRSENILKWGKIPFLGKDDYYYEKSQSPNLNIKIMLPAHESDPLNDKIVKSLQSTLNSYLFDKIYICCICKLNFDNIGSIVYNKGTSLAVYQKIKRCKDDVCTLSQNNINKPAVISQFTSEDKIKDKCKILTDDPKLIQKYNRIIEDNSALFSTHAYDIGRCKNPDGPITGEY